MSNIFTSSSPGTSDVLIIPCIKNEGFISLLSKKLSRHGIKEAELSRYFAAGQKEVFQFGTPGQKSGQVLLLGLGENPGQAWVIARFRALFHANKTKWKGKVVVDLRGNIGLAECVANGILLGSYEMGMLKTREEEEENVYNDGTEITFWVGANQEVKAKEAVEKGIKTAETQMNMMALVNAPSNYKTPQMMVDYISKSGKENGFQVTVFDEIQCAEMGFHALLAVGRGSVDRPARLVVMEYKGGGRHIGLVGKGVTFDTGGISLKPGDGMEDMKMDMGGSAAVIGTIELAARLGLPVNLTGIVAFTENCIDALAIKPGDVINSYAGKTIEVINTDAEGRLILADALHYMAVEFEPELMIDLATLTGSCIRTLGHHFAGMMTNNDSLARLLESAGAKTGEKVWRLPLTAEYRDELNSDVADIKNLGGPYAGATTAGKFLEFFTHEHPNWAHLDIAGTAFMKSEFSKGGSATAYGVRLLREVLEIY